MSNNSRANHRPLRYEALANESSKRRHKVDAAGGYVHATVEQLEPRYVLTAPTLGAISDVTLIAGAPLHIALNGFDADGDPLTFTATSTNAGVTTTIPTGNRSLKINVAGFGEMTFQLFEDLAPRATNQIISLANTHFYDGVKFHRILNNFVIQGGDPTGTGSGGSQLGDFDDQFNLALQHTSTGILSMAKSSDDTNDSQFFITEGAQRHLDFQHTIFGFLTTGESVREAISNVPASSAGVPNTPVVMSSVSVFTDTQNGVLRLSAPAGTTGTSNIKVTVSDGHGGTAERTFKVTIVADTVNNNPYLQDIPLITTTPNTPVTFTLHGIDAEGDAPFYFDAAGIKQYFNIDSPVTANPNLTYTVNQNSGLVTITPKNGIVGTFPIFVGTGNNAGNDGGVDTQVVLVSVTPPAPTGIDLDSGSDTGSSNTDNVTNLDNSTGKTLDFHIAGVTSGALVQVFSDNVLIGQAVASDTTVTVTTNQTSTLTNGPHAIRATQTVNSASSPLSTTLQITIDKAAPTFTSTAPLLAIQGQLYSYDAQTNEEGTAGLVYTLQNAPSGMTVNPATGLVNWTPTPAQSGQQSVVLRATDSAGNFVDQSFLPVVDLAPILDAISNKSVNLGSQLTFTATATDPTGQTLTYSLGAGAPAGATIDPSTGVFSWTPTAAQAPGPQSITIRVTDSVGASDSETFQVTINVPPVLAPIGDKTINGGELFTLVVNATDANPGSTLTYSLDPGTPAGVTFNAATRTLSWTPSTGQTPGSYQFTIRVTDETGLADSETFGVTVIKISHPPVLPAISDKEVTEDQLLSFTVTATDADDDAITYSLTGGVPAGAAINSTTGVFTWTPTQAQAPGLYTLTVKATDSGGQATTRSFQVTVIDVNEAPVLANLPNRTVSEGTLLSFTATATDPNSPHETLTFSLTGNIPAGAAINSTTGQFTWTPTEAQGPGSYNISLKVTDARGLSDTKTFTVNVGEVDQAPVFDQVASQLFFPGQLVSVQLHAIDPDLPAKGVTYQLVSGPAGSAVDAVTGEFTWTPPAGTTGDFNVTVRAIEANNGLTTLLSFPLTVGVDQFGLQLTQALVTAPALVPALGVPLNPSLLQQINLPPLVSPAAQNMLLIDPLDRIQSGGDLIKPKKDGIGEDDDGGVVPASGESPVQGDLENSEQPRPHATPRLRPVPTDESSHGGASGGTDQASAAAYSSEQNWLADAD